MLHRFLWFGTTNATNASLLWTTSVEEIYHFFIDISFILMMNHPAMLPSNSVKERVTLQ